jgi:uncharacterized protein (DUF433 family)
MSTRINITPKQYSQKKIITGELMDVWMIALFRSTITDKMYQSMHQGAL